MRICCISDTHGQYRRVSVPKCDLLIHAGDITGFGFKDEVLDFNDWLGSLPVTHKVVIAGNHDGWFFNKTEELLTNGIYLENSPVKIDGLTIYGSPMTPTFGDWYFMADRGEDIKKYWDKIEMCDILVTHGPSYGVLDSIKNREHNHLGCEELAKAVKQVKPRLHVFGHIHSSHGQVRTGKTICVNASVLDEYYAIAYKPIMVNLK